MPQNYSSAEHNVLFQIGCSTKKCLSLLLFPPFHRWFLFRLSADSTKPYLNIRFSARNCSGHLLDVYFKHHTIKINNRFNRNINEFQ